MTKGCGFKSRHHIPDGHDIFTLICFKKCFCLFEKTENKRIKGPGLAHFLKKETKSKRW